MTQIALWAELSGIVLSTVHPALGIQGDLLPLHVLVANLAGETDWVEHDISNCQAGVWGGWETTARTNIITGQGFEILVTVIVSTVNINLISNDILTHNTNMREGFQILFTDRPVSICEESVL